MIFNHLEFLCEKQKQQFMRTQTDFQKANSYLCNQLKILQINLKINNLDDGGLRALHESRTTEQPDTEQPAWSTQIFKILTKTRVPESGREMIYDNLAGFYEHHLNMFRMHKKQEPYWNIIETATFVLDIADEEFRQEKEYDENEFIKAKQSQMAQADQPQMPKRNALKLNSLDSFTQRRSKKTPEEKYNTDFGITLRTNFKKNFLRWTKINLQAQMPKRNDLKLNSLDPFTQRRLKKTLEEKYNTDYGITLRTNFKKNFLRWIEINLQDFQEAGLGRSPLKIFNELCVSAKEGQGLRLAQG